MRCKIKQFCGDPSGAGLDIIHLICNSSPPPRHCPDPVPTC